MKESVLHTIWGALKFDVGNIDQELQRGLHIVNPGELNFGDGPDFLNACILMDGLRIYGDIEIHIKPGDWYNHGHHRDERYNSVILHVVLEQNSKRSPILRQDETEIPEIALKPLLKEEVGTLLQGMQSNDIPCAENIKYLNDDILRNHIREIHAEYFEFKIEQMMQVYPAHLDITDAWKYLMLRFVFEAFGYGSNTEAMARLYHIIQSEIGLEKITEKQALEYAGLSEFSPASGMQRKHWDLSGNRPANQPKNRIPQALYLCKILDDISWKYFLKTDPEKSWKDILQKSEVEKIPGKQRLLQIYHTVYVPSLYILGILSGNRSLCNQSKKIWMNTKSAIPGGIKKKFRDCGWPHDTLKYAGITHLYKRHCSKLRCQDCSVLKAVINS